MTQDESSLLYDYPDDSFSRVEGKSLLELENEIMAGGPFPESRVSRIYMLADDQKSPLHFVAKYFLYLSYERAKQWKLDRGQSLMPIPEGCSPNTRCSPGPKT